LARATPGPAVDVAAQPLLEPQARTLEDLRVEVAPVVDDDDDRTSRRERGGGRAQRGDDAVCIRGDGGATGSTRGRTERELPPVVEPQQLVGVAVLLVVVDQAGVGRRRDHAVEAALE